MGRCRLLLRELPLSEQPLCRLVWAGEGALTNAELIEVVLGNGQDAGRELLSRFGGVLGLARTPLSELEKRPEVGIAGAARLKAAFELGRRLAAVSEQPRPQIKGPGDAAKLLVGKLGTLEQEEVWVLSLDSHGQLIAMTCVARGGLSSSGVRTADVFREAVRHNAASIVLAHNHTSGSTEPSPDDVAFTQKLVRAGEELDIDLLDHIVVGGSKYSSMAERGILDTALRMPRAAS